MISEKNKYFYMCRKNIHATIAAHERFTVTCLSEVLLVSNEQWSFSDKRLKPDKKKNGHLIKFKINILKTPIIRKIWVWVLKPSDYCWSFELNVNLCDIQVGQSQQNSCNSVLVCVSNQCPFTSSLTTTIWLERGKKEMTSPNQKGKSKQN